MFTIQQLSGGKMHCAQGAPSLLLVTQTSVSVQIKIQQLQFSLNTVVDLVEQGTPIDLVFLSDGGSGRFETLLYIFYQIQLEL